MSLAAETTMAITAALESAVNTYIAMDPDAQAEFAKFSDKVIAINVDSTGLILYCLPHSSGITIMTRYEGEPDTVICGRPVSLAKLSIFSDTRVMFEGDVTIRGDVQLGQRFKRAIESIDIDWEEHLSRITGDVIAHKTGHMIREMANWWRANQARAQNNGREYLQQELQVIPSREEIEDFYKSVDDLRDDVARLETRLKMLSSKQTENS